ncbi:MAG: hypothetical protein AAF579_16740 [Cyanobacteria bacterium P01_C01_bin.118]
MGWRLFCDGDCPQPTLLNVGWARPTVEFGLLFCGGLAVSRKIGEGFRVGMVGKEHKDAARGSSEFPEPLWAWRDAALQPS